VKPSSQGFVSKKRTLLAMTEIVATNSALPTEPIENDIVFISDLHFDFTKGKYKAKAAPLMEEHFISFVKEHYSQNILCSAGDFYNDYKKSLSFVKKLEEKQIRGFFVLGNHDYWNGRKLSYTEIIDLFLLETQNHQYFQFLVTGRKFYFNDVCIIGDTGWTSFQRMRFQHRGRKEPPKQEPPEQVPLEQFMHLPDARSVKDFNPKNIIALHDKWVSFANDIMRKEEKVLIITHFPMFYVTREEKDCWWSSATQLVGDNSWRIFGHIHQSKRIFNNVSSQRGYENKDVESLQRAACRRQYLSYCYSFENNDEYREKRNACDAYVETNWSNAIPENQYNSSDFKKLIKLAETSDIATTNGFESIATFYTPALVPNNCMDTALILGIKKRGYRRCSANKFNLAALANDHESYISYVKKSMDKYKPYIGYALSGGISYQMAKAINNSIDILENGDTSDIRAFMTAAVITGYVFNGMPDDLMYMRPLDDYDIMRFWMMFLTIKQFNIDVYDIEKIQRDERKQIHFANIDLYLPSINGNSLNVNDVKLLLQKTTLLAPLS
jgi:predicted phosphohydrolase